MAGRVTEFVKRQLGVDKLERDVARKDELISSLSAELEDASSERDLLLEQKSRGNTDEVASGVEISFGQFYYEKNKKLSAAGTRWDELHAMANDPAVTSALRRVVLPLTRASWTVEPASDKRKDKEIAAFVASNLFRTPDSEFGYGHEYFCRTSWKAQRLAEILDFLESGYSMFNKTTRVVNNKLVYDRLQWLEPRSVDPSGWILDDNDDIKRIERTYQDASMHHEHREELPVGQLALYVYGLKGARYEGRPFTRAMWGAYTRKAFLSKMKGIWSQKAGAPAPYGFAPFDGWSAEERTRFARFIQSNRGTARAEAYFAGRLGPNGEEPKVGYAGADLDLERGFDSMNNAENAEIARAGMDKGQLLGETESGNRALGQTMSLNEYLMVEAIGILICEWETHGVGNLRGNVEELVGWNWADVKDLPQIKITDVNPIEKIEERDARTTGWEKGIIPKTPEARRQLVEESYGMELEEDAYEVEEPPAFGPPGATPPPGQPPVPGQQQADPAAPPVQDNAVQAEGGRLLLETKEQFKQRVAQWLQPMGDAARGHRPDTRVESLIVQLDAVNESLRTGARDLTVELRETHRLMIEDLITRLQDGKITPDTLKSQRRSVFKGSKRVQKRLAKLYEKVAQEGADAVREELSRFSQVSLDGD